MAEREKGSGLTKIQKLLLGAVAVASLACIVALLPLGVGGQSKTPRELNWDFKVREDADSQVETVAALLNPAPGTSGVDSGSEEGGQGGIPAGDASGEPLAQCAAHQVLLAVDGSLTEGALVNLLAKQDVTATDVRLVSRSLEDEGVLVDVTYEGDEHPEAMAQRLGGANFVRSAGANYIETLCEEESGDEPAEGPVDQLDSRPNDPYYGSQWGNDAIGAPAAWDIVKANRNTTVAVIDSGVDADHPDLVDNLILGSQVKNTYTGQTGTSAIEDQNGHGTHVAGIVAATANNSLGVAGVSYNARVLPIKVTYNTRGQMYISDVIEAIDYVTGLKTSASSPASLKDIRVINLSLGGYVQDTSGQYQAAIDRATNAGVVVVAAAGNDATSVAHYPSAYSNVIGVSALKKQSGGGYCFDDSYSNYGSYVDLAAPGTSVYSTVPDGYGNKGGTSMATPMVSGAAALLFAKHPAATPALVETILSDCADDLGSPGRDWYYGSGAVRMDRAVGARRLELAVMADVPDQLLVAGGVTPEPSITYEGRRLRKGTDYTLSYENNTSEGVATVTATGAGDYTGVLSKSFTIYTLDLEDASASGIASQSYTGSAIEPPFTLTHRGKTLKKDVDYTVEYADNVNVGTARAVVTGKGAYEGSKTVTFTIEPRALSAVEAGQVPTQGYTGGAICPQARLSHNGIPLAEGTDFTVAYENNVACGMASMTMTGRGNFTGSVSRDFEIARFLRKPQEEGIAYTYSGGEQSVVSMDDLEWLTVDGTAKATNAGIQTVTLTPKEHAYWDDGTNGPVSVEWRINAKVIDVPAADPDAIHTGSAVQGVPDGEGYALTGDVTAVEEGTYTVTATLVSRTNYVWPDGTVEPKSIEWTLGSERYIAVPASVEGLVYNGEEQSGVPGGKGYKLSGDVVATDAGTYSTKVSLVPGYHWNGGNDGTVTLSWSIARKRTAAPQDGSTVYTYDGSVKDVRADLLDGFEGIVAPEVTQVSLGSEHSAAITSDGSLYTWGNNASGRLGDGTTTARSTPVKVLDGVTQVSLGSEHSAAITSDGSLYTWGNNYYGQLGDDTKMTGRTTPVKVLDGVAQVSLGENHSAAITSDGSLYTWGYNNYGQLGDGTTTDRSKPVKVLDGVAQVSLGADHSAAITYDGSLYTWGRNGSGQLGDGTTTKRSKPKKVLAGIARVSLGGFHSAAIASDGSLYTWGYNACGRLGDGTTTDRSTPVKVLDGVAQVSLGKSYSAAITSDGSLYTWGYNAFGQLGDGTTTDRSTPVKVLDGVARVSLGDYHSAAIASDGSLYTWGDNHSGKLGDGNFDTSETRPCRVVAGSVRASDAGEYDCRLLLNNNYCWEDGSTDPRLFAWSIARKSVPTPTQLELTYNGEEQAGFAQSDEYVLSGTAFGIDAGTYAAIATPANGNYAWDDGTTDPKQIQWSIAPRPIDPATLANNDLVYNGSRQIGVRSGIGYAIKSGNASATEAGDYEATVSLTDTNHIWSDGTTEDKVITWRLHGMVYDMSGVAFEDATFTYDGEKHAIQVSGSLPDGVSVTYEGNDQIVAGAHLVTAHFAGDATSHEPIADMTATLTIDPILVEAPTAESGLTYNGTTQAGIEVPGDARYQVSGTTEAADAGVYVATLSLDDKQNLAWDMDGRPSDDLDVRWMIAPRDIVGATVGEIGPYVYSPVPATPAPNVNLDGKDLQQGRDYVISYVDNDRAGEAKARIEGIGNYDEFIEAPFTIEPCPVNNAEVRFNDTEFAFTREAIEPAPTVIVNGTTLVAGKDYDVEYADNVLPGTAKATIAGKGNYTGTAEATFTISEVPIAERTSIQDAVIALNDDPLVYDGRKKEPGVTVTLGGAELAEGLDYVVGYQDNIAAGRAKVTVVGVGGYKDSRVVEFDIEAADIAGATVDPIKDQVYAGGALTPRAIVKYGGMVLSEDTDYTVSYRGNVNAGTATLTVTGKGNYAGTKSASFKIKAASLSGASVSLPKTSYDHTGKAIAPVPTVTLGGTTLRAGVDYAVSYKNNVNPGTATVTVTGRGNYAGAKSATFRIAAPKPAPVSTAQMYRLYNPYSGEHFYTASPAERDMLSGIGWNYEGVGWKAPTKSNTPVYRLYNPYVGDHHYTTSAGERDALSAVGWSFEGVGWYSDDARGVPLWRQYNPYATVGTHNYTSSKGENDALVSVGWRAEGIGWYGVA